MHHGKILFFYSPKTQLKTRWISKIKYDSLRKNKILKSPQIFDSLDYEDGSKNLVICDALSVVHIRHSAGVDFLRINYW